MKGDIIYYQEKNAKYWLRQDYSLFIGILGYNIKTDFVELRKDGWLLIRKGFVWDGPSGPTFDTKDSMRGSLVHDVLYMLMRLGLLPQSCRQTADKLLHDICNEDGMLEVRADIWEAAVEDFAAGAAKLGTEPPILTAP